MATTQNPTGPITLGDPGDSSVDVESFSEEGWRRALDQKRLEQQDLMITAMIKIFKWLNGGVLGFVVAAWLAGFWGEQKIITEHVVMSLIGATIIQAGVAFIAITKYLFPSAGAEKPEKGAKPSTRGGFKLGR